MINFENGMLVLNNTFSKEDVDAINEYTNYIRNQERERLAKLFEESDSVCVDWALAILRRE